MHSPFKMVELFTMYRLANVIVFHCQFEEIFMSNIQRANENNAVPHNNSADNIFLKNRKLNAWEISCCRNFVTWGLWSWCGLWLRRRLKDCFKVHGNMLSFRLYLLPHLECKGDLRISLVDTMNPGLMPIIYQSFAHF